MSRMRVGRVIKAYRATGRVSTVTLAGEIGVSRAALNRIENGKGCDTAALVKVLVWLFGPEGK